MLRNLYESIADGLMNILCGCVLVAAAFVVVDGVLAF
jgi:hypothetical protein